jgi:hypothetical protein
MKKLKNSNLTFTINVKDFNTNNDAIDYLKEAIRTSLELNQNKKFLKDMKQASDIKLSLKKNLKVKIKDCGCV